ncbi:MAG: hypothetical protein IKH99_08450 [Prevotella sp.]|nr:hypothetical protein [Prevotella sp.]
MKKLFTLLVLALCAVGVKAQTTYSFDTSNITESDLTITNGSFSNNVISSVADNTKTLTVEIKNIPITFSYACQSSVKKPFKTGNPYFQADVKGTTINFTGLSVGDVIEIEYCSKNSSEEKIAGSLSGLKADEDNVASTSTSNIVKNKFTATATTASITESTNGYRLYSITITKATGVAAPKITKSTEQVGSINVTMTADEGATIKYTINGGSEQTYSSAFTVDSYAEVTAWAVKGEDESAKVSATYVVMPNLSSGKKWDFANISETDWTNLSSDTDGWTFDSDNNRYYNNKAINGIITANHQALAATEGLKFNAGSEKIRINKGTGQLQLNGKDLPIFIPNLKTGQYITVIAKSGSSNATNRYISATNVEGICGFAESGTANVVTSIGKVTADGEVDLKTINGGMNILSIEITNDIPSYEVTVSIAGFATFTPSLPLDFSSTTIKAYKALVSGSNISFTRVNQVAAGEGVLLYAEGGATENIPVGNKSAADSDNAFIGTLTDIASLATLSDDGAYTNYILNDGTSGIGFYKANGQKVAAGKAYLQVASSSSPAKSFFGFDAFNGNSGVVTGINEVKAVGNDNVLYNLNGVRMTSPTQKGIYILNGKKYIVK